MRSRWRLPLLLVLALSVFGSCQRDIPLLGEEEGEVDHDTVFLWAITLNGYDTLDPQGMPWDSSASYLHDSMDYWYPDVFYNFDTYDTVNPFSYYQQTHFLNVSPDTLPVSYQLVPNVLVPWYTPFFLRIYDFELDTPSVDSTFMDSILFVVGPDTVGPEKYPRTVTGIGPNGASVTLSLLWK